MKKTLLLFGFLLSIINLTQAKSDTEVKLKKLDQYFSKIVKDWDVPSMTIGIVKDNKLVFTGSYGVLEVGKKKKPDSNTLYAIASNSKAFTSAIIATLVQEGKLNWDDKVKTYLPYFELYDPWVSNEVTIRDLLSHRVGLGTFSGDVIWYKSSLTSEEIIRCAKYLPKAFDFRSGYGYSNLMYITAGEIIKKVTGKSWGENVKERLLEPLSMDRTISTTNDLKKTENYSTPHARIEDVNVPIKWENWEEIGAMGGLISSVNDISKWMIFNLNNGIHGSDTILTASSRNMIWTPHNNFNVDHTSTSENKKRYSGYGLGWGLSDYHGKLRVSHTGGYDGMLSSVSMIPDENLGVVVLSNGIKSPFMAATYYALDQFMGNPKRDWSAEYLKRTEKRAQNDTRISDIKASRVLNTQATLSKKACSGIYKSDIYGEIRILLEDTLLRVEFEHAPELSATLEHWNYDVWEIKWDEPHAWFSFGTVKFNANNRLKVTGLDFDVPNNDIFFEELKPYKIK